MFTEINTLGNFLFWAKKVNHTSMQCDLQDVFARSDIKTLKKLFIESGKNDKHLLIFSIQKCMGSETLIDFIRYYALSMSNKYIEEESQEINSRWNEVLTYERNVKDKMEVLENENKKLKDQIADIKKDNDTLQKTVSDYYFQNTKLQDKIDNLEVLIIEYMAFEKKVKSMLNG